MGSMLPYIAYIHGSVMAMVFRHSPQTKNPWRGSITTHQEGAFSFMSKAAKASTRSDELPLGDPRGKKLIPCREVWTEVWTSWWQYVAIRSFEANDVCIKHDLLRPRMSKITSHHRFYGHTFFHAEFLPICCETIPLRPENCCLERSPSPCPPFFTSRRLEF